ncbi:Reverse transcriptase [Phytophthora palmivora]|uniref:Reverse transcriptase n=1 Tax=Phytophthora palmivora TaxID=4796 RepID=A0A2P4Y0K8_9STRA|nr:Reverse transcriptase [Phytophthora palmivora]
MSNGTYALSPIAARARADHSSEAIQPARPFQLVFMDFVKPLRKSGRGNTALLPFQCAFPGFEMGKPMVDTTALSVAKAFEKCVYRRVGAPTLIRYDRDPRFMSEVKGDPELPVYKLMVNKNGR